MNVSSGLTKRDIDKFITLQREKMMARFEARQNRIKFVKKNFKKITTLSTEGWPRTKNMKDYPEWFTLVYKAKILGLYAFTTANCDVIAMLRGVANSITKVKKK